MDVCPIPFVAIQLLLPDLKIGSIGLWSGSIGTIPSGWKICDGTSGTPDLRNKFIIAAGDTFIPDDFGGTDNHTEFTSGNGHTHMRNAGSDIQAGSDYDRELMPTNVDGISDPSSNVPPYYALAYVMFLG